ncbi:MAG: hypothetical protein WAV54_11500 [Acidimicrobiales bacterium]
MPSRAFVTYSLDGVLDEREGATDVGGGRRLVRLKERSEEPPVELGIEDRDAQTLGG